MKQGRIHLYCGDGKGKTTAAVGLTVRAAGHGIRTVFVQFLKDESSGDRALLRRLDEVTVMPNPQSIPFSFQMTEEQKQKVLEDQEQRIRQAFALAEQQAEILVLDEAVGAIECGLLREETVLTMLRNRPEKLEVVLTGREPSSALLEMADYVTEMHKRRHPFENGVSARAGIEW